MRSWTATTRWIAALAAVCGVLVPANAGADSSPIVVTTTQTGVGINICSSGCVQVVTVVNVSIVMVYVGAPPAASVRVTPRRIDFGAVPRGSSSPVRLVRLVNTGPTPLVLSATGVTGPQSTDFRIRSTTCLPGAAPAALLQPRTGCTIGVGFSPSAPGRRDATLSLTVNQTAYGVQLTGHSSRPAGLAAFPAALNFGNVAVHTSATRAVRLRNVGESPLMLRSLSVTGDYTLASDCLRGAAPRILPAQAWCTVRVRFTPTVTGTRSGSIIVADDAGGGPHVVPLTGTGVSAPPRVFMPVARVAAAPSGGSGADPAGGGAGANAAPGGRSDSGATPSGRFGERAAGAGKSNGDPEPAQPDGDSAQGVRPNPGSTRTDEPSGQTTSQDSQNQGKLSGQSAPVVVPAPQTATPSTPGQTTTSPAVARHPQARVDHRGTGSPAGMPPSAAPVSVPARRDLAAQDTSVVATQLASHSTTTSAVSAPLRAAASLPLVWWFIALLATTCLAAAMRWHRTTRARRLCGLLRR